VLAFVPSLWWVLGAKVAENSTDYSLNNTVRNILFLPCSREEKYSAKQAIDSFFRTLLCRWGGLVLLSRGRAGQGRSEGNKYRKF